MNAGPAVAAPVVGSANAADPPFGTADASSPAAAAFGTGWVAGHLPLPTPSGFAGHHAVPATLCTTLVLSALALSVFAVPLALAFWIALAMTIEVSWRRRSERVDKRAVVSHEHDLSKRSRGAARTLKSAESTAVAARKQQQDAATQLNTDRSSAAAKLQTDLKGVEADLTKEIDQIRAARGSIASTVAQRRQNELRRLQSEHVTQQLSSASIQRTNLAGVGDNLKRNLAANGIATAADFTGVAIGASSGRYSNQVAYFIRRSGGRVRVSGIGPVKARTLDNWRNALTARANQSAPTTLSQSTEHALRAQVKKEEDQLTARETAVRASADRRRHDIQSAYARTTSEFDTRAEDLRKRNTAAIATAEQRLAAARKEWGQADLEATQAQRSRQSFRHITRTRYVWFLATGRP